MTHSFETEDAEKYGVNAAVILSNMRFWIAKNQANKRHEYDGKTWTYNSVKAFGELFPYLSTKQIRTAIQKLVEAGEIGEGNYNKSSYDRTKWYCLLKKIHLTKKENPFAPEGEPIPDNKPDSNSNSKPIVQTPAIAWSVTDGWTGITEQDREDWKEAYPACDITRQLAAMNQWLKANPSKAKKKKWRLFLTNWLGRSQERGGDAKSNPQGYAEQRREIAQERSPL